MNKIAILFFSVITLAFTSCKEKTKQNEPEVVTVNNSDPKNYEIAKTEAEFNDPKIEAVFNQYMQVETALVNSDATKTAAEAAKLDLLLKEMNAEENTQHAVAAMASSEDIGVQRKNFEVLSSGMETILKGAIKSGMLYKQFCPMAFDRGAYWISSSKDILNPYYGDSMLKCGRVDSEVK